MEVFINETRQSAENKLAGTRPASATGC